MSDAVHAKVEAIRGHHERLKDRKHGYLVRPLTIIGGWLITFIGIFTIPLPGPGWFLVFLGIGVLSLELVWPHRLLNWSLRQYDRCEEWMARRSRTMQVILSIVGLIVVGILLLMLFVLGWNMGMFNWGKSWMLPIAEKIPFDVPNRIGMNMDQ